MLLIQVIAILFAFAMAWHDAPAVSRFGYSGIPDSDQKIFHKYNWWAKLFFCCMAALIAGWGLWLKMFVFASISAFWIYLVFDPALNVRKVPKPGIWYIGHSAFWDQYLILLFGEKKAGKIKFLIILSLIATINLVIGIKHSDWFNLK